MSRSPSLVRHAEEPLVAIPDHSTNLIGVTARLGDEQGTNLLLWVRPDHFQQTLQNLWTFAKQRGIPLPK